MVFQEPRLLPWLSVAENVAFALQVIGASRRRIEKVVPETLDMVGLGTKADRRPHELSGGEQQRVAIARAFVNRPVLLLADEPTGNLDPETSEDIMLLLDRINSPADLRGLDAEQLAGTMIDHGSLAPMGVFVKAFAEFGVEITVDPSSPSAIRVSWASRPVPPSSTGATAYVSISGPGTA